MWATEVAAQWRLIGTKCDRRLRNAAPKPWARILRATTALTAAGGISAAILVTPASAQTVLPPNQSLPYAPLLSGTNGNPGNNQTNAQSGFPGGPGTSVNIQVPDAVTWLSGGPALAISLVTSGGNGGNGGNSTYQGDSYSNGGDGGAAGSAAAVTLQVNGSVQQPSSITSQGTVVQLIANGGTGGTGGLPANHGTGGQAGAAGNAATVNFGQQAGSTLQSTGAGAPTVLLQSIGGSGGNGGENTVTNIDTAHGPNGAPGVVGGTIQTVVPIAGSILSAGSGIVAVSQGGAGGYGASAGTTWGTKAYGGSGGLGAGGGFVSLNLTGAMVTATGAPGAGTGGQIIVDAVSGTTTAIASVMSAAVLGSSAGGAGGYGDVANGNVSSHGGNGGNGGNGGPVQIQVDGGSLKTTGYGAMGAVAVSAGAGGGSGGEAGAIFSRSGGAGGIGGDGGSAVVTLLNGAVVTTTGRHSDGALALSVGGGGGVGGDVEGGGVGMSIAFGGSGGQGGSGGNATVSNGTFASGFTAGGAVSTTGTLALGLAAISVGGGGGRGGDANTADLGVLAFPIGGSGGTGGAGEWAQAFNYGVVQTTGLHAAGLTAQSVGGGGGTGGAAHAYNVGVNTLALSASASVGGSGGGCSTALGCPTGGTATVMNYGQALTMGGDANAIRAQSVGGGGGAGGASVAENLMVNLTPEDTPTVQLTAAIGGKGGSGGDGGQVIVLNAGIAIAQGVGAHGILAQSIGGGGGHGGDSTATTSAFTPASLTIGVALGGSGGGGGTAGTVNVYNSGLVWTLNHLAAGIAAQSIGGGGGNGGYGDAHTGTVTGADGDGLQVNLSLGGSGAAGGNGSSVSVYNYVTTANTPDKSGYGTAGVGAGGIVTLGDSSDGILAQSVGGGGGIGGHATANGGAGTVVVNVSLGGIGGAGGTGGTVLVDNGAGSILTTGGHSAGIFAQSVGGGGGRGGNGGRSGGGNPNYSASALLEQGLGLGGNVTKVLDGVYQWAGKTAGAFGEQSTLGSVASAYSTSNMAQYTADTPESSNSSLTVKLGAGISGKGGAGGDGGNVTVLNAGSIQTSGPLSPAIFGQSIGGGGGLGGASNPAMDKVHASQSAIGLSISLGGAGGLSGIGQSVTVTDSGVITTGGDASPGILAQSVGGGGGHAGVTMMAAGDTLGVVTLGMDRTTNGSTPWNATFGGPVNVTTSNVTTTGNDSPGVLAQSVGGGGGIAAVMSGIFNPQTGGWRSVTNNLGLANPQWVDFRFMGDAPTGSYAGTVNVTLQPNGTTPGGITTSGRNAYGILAQAVGNGGGIAITDYTPLAGANFVNPGQSVSGNNGAGVTVTTLGPSVITTTGDGAVGIFAQSVSGGGIVGGMDGVALQYQTVASQAQSFGGTVTVNNSADIHVSGAYAHGIFAQSTSLGGVFGTSNAGPGTLATAASAGSCGTTCADNGQVTVNHNGGTIYVHGANAYGVVMVSQGNPTGTNNTALNVTPAGWIATDDQAAGAVFIGGADTNTVTNYGIINAAAAGLAFGTWTANPRATASIDNYGGIMGSAVLGDGSSITNHGGGTWQMGSTVDLGTAGRVANAGTLEVGYGRAIATTSLTGNLQQGTAGRLVVDTDHVAGKGDMLVVQGKAELAGKVETRPLTVANAPVTVLTATGGLTLDPATTGSRTTAFSFQPLSDGTRLRIQPQADFLRPASALSATQQQVAGHLQQLWNSRAPLGPDGFTRLAGIQDGTSYGRALTTLSGQTVGAIAASRFASSQAFATSMHSCPAFVDESQAMRETRCAWMRVTGSTTSQAAGTGALGYRVNGATVQAGWQWQLAPDWFLGATAAYETSRFSGDQSTSTVRGNGALAGAALKYQRGGWLLSGSVDAGFGTYDSSRRVEVGNFFGIASASPQSWHIGGSLRVSYQAAFQRFYLKPIAELRAVQVSSSGYTEAGAAPFNLTVAGQTSATIAGTGAMEIGSRFRVGEAALLHAYASVGLTVMTQDGWVASARIAGAPAGAPGFQATTPVPNTLGRFTVGANLFATEHVEFKLQYNADVGDGFSAHTGIARFTYRF